MTLCSKPVSPSRDDIDHTQKKRVLLIRAPHSSFSPFPYCKADVCGITVLILGIEPSLVFRGVQGCWGDSDERRQFIKDSPG